MEPDVQYVALGLPRFFNCDVRSGQEAAAAKAGEPVPLNAVVLSNEKNFTAPFTLPADGQWRPYEAELVLDFDPAVTDLVALHLKSGIPTDELRFKNLSLTKGD